MLLFCTLAGAGSVILVLVLVGVSLWEPARRDEGRGSRPGREGAREKVP